MPQHLRPTYYWRTHQAIRFDETYHFQSGLVDAASYRIEAFTDPIVHAATAKVRGTRVHDIDVDGELKIAILRDLENAILGAQDRDC